MTNPFDFLMEQAKKVQADLSGMEEKLAAAEVTAESGAGLVRVVMNGHCSVTSLTIDDSLMTEDKTVLQDLLTAAVNSAYKKVEKLKAEQFGGMAGGLDLSSFMKKG